MAQRQQRRGIEGTNLGQVVMDDIRKTKLQRDYLQEFRDLYAFYIDDESRTRLEGMGRIRRAFSLLWWILKSLLLNLSPPRRLMLLIGLVLGFLGPQITPGGEFSDWGQFDTRPWGTLMLLILLMLELKDKLVARDEIEIARQVQLALLPREHPTLPGWTLWSHSRPANDVGGDLVDYIELDGFRHGVLLGDVAGKGLGAALLTAKLQATLRALVPDAVSLDDLGRQVNGIFYRDGLDNRYATLFYCEIEYNSEQLRFLNAGHNPAFLLRPDTVEELQASSRPVGMLEHAIYEEGVRELHSGDLLIVYSDGLTEAEDSEGQDFGVERLKALLPELRPLEPEEAGARILQEVDAFLGEARLIDDLSLVIVRKQ